VPVAILGGAVLLIALALAGCGSDARQAGQALQPAEDVVLFDGDVAPDKSGTPPTPKAQQIGVALKTNGHFYSKSVSLFDVVAHSFTTTNGVAYQVEVIGARCGDDPDLYLSRNPEPGSYPWKQSRRNAPLMDGIVFRSTQDGTMYVGVYGDDNTGGDGTVEYLIHVRQCSFGEFQQ